MERKAGAADRPRCVGAGREAIPGGATGSSDSFDDQAVPRIACFNDGQAIPVFRNIQV